MVRLRAEKVARIADRIPACTPTGDAEGDLVVVGWGSTHGVIEAAVRAQRAKGRRIGHVHLRHLNPFPKQLEVVLRSYRRVLVVEMNLGQLLFVLRGTFLLDAIGLQKVQGQPFRQSEIEAKIEEVLR
jgi:2-oxoglutarate ferredoxin oxidoreductase subunit alpha